MSNGLAWLIAGGMLSVAVSVKLLRWDGQSGQPQRAAKAEETAREAAEVERKRIVSEAAAANGRKGAAKRWAKKAEAASEGEGAE